MKKRFLFTLAMLTFWCASGVSALPPLRIEGGKVFAGNREIRLRGINWGWFHDANTVYSEADMKNQAEWGANMLRLTIRYTDVADENGNWNEERAARVDEVIRWAEKYGQYVILDMHELPGGQTPVPYCYGGKMLFWSDPEFQRLTCGLWKRIAERYRKNPVVGAYEIMNEPKTWPSNPALCSELQRKVLNAIREADPEKVAVITGDFAGNGSKSLTDVVKVDDPNILYTIHYYSGEQGPWLFNLGEQREHLEGTRDWFLYEFPFSVPADKGVEEVTMLLRTNKNRGTVWFDEARMFDAGGNILHGYDFDPGKKALGGFSPEREGGVLRHDPKVGHLAPGSLSVGGTGDGYNGWMTCRWKVEPGKSYKFSAWIKTENATGSSFVAVALFGKPKMLTSDEIYGQLLGAKGFAGKYNVPVFVGEFGLRRKEDAARQAREVALRIRAFERAGFHWCYWNYKATDSVEGFDLITQRRSDSVELQRNGTLLEVLRNGWKSNGRK